MRVQKRLSRLVGAVTGVCLLAGSLSAGCSSAQNGTAEPQDWTGSPVYSGLQSIAATDDSKFEIGLVSPQKLNAIDTAAPTPKPTTAAVSGMRPESEYVWVNYAIAGSVCGLLESQQGVAVGYRTGPPGDMLSVYNGSADTGQMIGVCQGDTDPTKIKGTAKTVDGVDGIDVGGLWLGRSNNLTYQFGDKVTDGIRGPLLAKTATSGSLADDPDVRAVLDASPQAAAIEMGTLFTHISNVSSKSPLPALLSAVESAQGKKMSTPTFGGYGWTSTDGLTGTGSFVTRYGSAAEATTAAALLSAIWPKATGSPFAAATSKAQDQTVVTAVPQVKVTEFNLRNLRIAEYPGFVPVKNK